MRGGATLRAFPVQFGFALGNHSPRGISTLLDIVDALAGQMMDLGYAAHRHDDGLRTAPDYVNVVVEGFTPQTAARLDGSRSRGIRFILIMTEKPGRRAFNDVESPEMVRRQKCAVSVIKEAEAVWCLIPGVSEWVRRFNANAVDVELGWSATRDRLFWSTGEPVGDFAFFGSLTRRRQQIIARIRRSGATVWTGNGDGLGSLRQRNFTASQARVILGIHPIPRWASVSNSRFATALSLGRPVICEPPRGATPWSDVGVFCHSAATFVEEAIDLLPRWQDARNAQVAKFRELFSPARCVGEAIRRTLPAIAADAA